MPRTALTRRLHTLQWVELLNAFWVPAACWLMARNAQAPLGPTYWLAATTVAGLLVQGSLIWWVVRRALATGKLSSWVPGYRNWKWTTVALVGAATLGSMWLPAASRFENYCAACLLGLAWLEVINYFDVQLLYEHRNDRAYLARFGRLKPAKLKQLLLRQHPG